MSEGELKAQIRLALGRRPDVRLFNNPVGMGWQGKVVERTKQLLVLEYPREVAYGLAPGSADLVGWVEVVITPDMVGKTIAQFLSGEVKTLRGRVEPEQVNWRDRVLAAGGRAGILRSVDDAVALVGAAHR